MIATLESVLPSYGMNEDNCSVKSFGTGLINHTWKVDCGQDAFILQKVNHAVFTQPELIADNIRQIADYLKKTAPDYLFIAPISNRAGADLIHSEDEGYFRMFPFVKGSHAIAAVENPDQAREAARQFGRFTRLLSGFPAAALHPTIPRFHDLELRYEQFKTALKQGNSARLEKERQLVEKARRHEDIVETFRSIKKNPEFLIRVTHHDSKISNVLFDEDNKGICVIDLDTVMPGYFISDVGDMMRTYLCAATEEETDLSQIKVRDEFYYAIVDGYRSEMGDTLTDSENEQFFYAGLFMIYMQALRFLTDYLNNDSYYGAKYPEHNRNRAANQFMLLERLLEKKELLSAYRG